MNPDTENFDSLRKLLALKRHETPPPGYFDRLPQQIFTRLERESSASPGWMEQMLPAFFFRPAFASVFGLLVCGTLFFGINHAPQPGKTPGLPAQGLALDSWEGEARTSDLSRHQTAGISLAPFSALDVASNGVPDHISARSLFENPRLSTQPAGFSYGTR